MDIVGTTIVIYTYLVGGLMGWLLRRALVEGGRGHDQSKG